jgi:hypothetical protein
LSYGSFSTATWWWNIEPVASALQVPMEVLMSRNELVTRPWQQRLELVSNRWLLLPESSREDCQQLVVALLVQVMRSEIEEGGASDERQDHA